MPLGALFSFFLAVRATADPGSAGADFLRIQVAPIPTALGGAFAAASGPDSLFYNPAGLALIERPSLSAAHNQYFEGLSQEYLAAAFPVSGLGVVSAGASYLHSGAIEAYDDQDNPAGSFSTSGGVFAVSLARRFPAVPPPGRGRPAGRGPPGRRPKAGPPPWRLGVGVSLKMISETIDDAGAQTPALDAGLLVRLPKELRLGASISNVGKKHKLDQEEFPLPRQVRVGVSRPFQLGSGISATAAADLLQDQGRPSEVLAGAEIAPLPWLSGRVGYRTKTDAGNGLSLGLGLGFDLEGGGVGGLKGIRLDYAFADGGPLQATHRLGVQLRW